MATDEGVLGRSLDFNFARYNNDHLHADGAERLYNIYRYEKDDDADASGLSRSSPVGPDRLCLFRNAGARRRQSSHPEHQGFGAAAYWTKARMPSSSIILDGENAWEYYPQSGREFLRRFYDALQRDEQIEPVTISEAIARHGEDNFGQLHRLVPGSWIDANFNVWIGAPEDNRAWDLLAEARDYYDRHSHRVSEAQRQIAWEELLIAEGSDWNWWYGPEHHSANDRDFDELYRKHLSNVYHALEGIPPEELNTPIISGVVRPSYHSADRLCARPGGRPGERIFRVDGRGQLHLRPAHQRHAWQTVSAGRGLRRAGCRLGFRPAGFSSCRSRWTAYRLVVNFEVWRRQASSKAAPDSYRLSVDAQGPKLQRWVLTNGEERHQAGNFLRRQWQLQHQRSGGRARTDLRDAGTLRC